jgi:hypothetical protein
MDAELIKILSQNGIVFDGNLGKPENKYTNVMELLESDNGSDEIHEQQCFQGSSSSINPSICQNINKFNEKSTEKRVYKVDNSRVPTALATMIAYELNLEEHLDSLKDFLTNPRFQCVFQKRMDKELTDQYKKACMGLGISVKNAIVHVENICKGVIGKGSSAHPCTKPAKPEFQGYCGLHKNLGYSEKCSVSSSNTHQCGSFTKTGKKCEKNVKLEETFCTLHKSCPILEPISKNTVRCKGIGKTGAPCNKFPLKNSEYCQQHFVMDTVMLQKMMEKIDI